MNALVTGGGGFLGSRIVEMLLERGDHVRILGRHHYEALDRLGADSQIGDIRDTASVVAAATGADIVFHVAALADVWGPRREFYEINVKGSANVIRACLDNKISCLVHTSSPSVAIGEADIEGGDETLPYPQAYLADYPASKAVAEKMVLEANSWEMSVEGAQSNPSGCEVRQLRTCALRPHLIWGPGDRHLIPRLVQTARAGKLCRVGNGTNKVDITYIDNAAHAHLQAADELAGKGRNAGKAYFIGDDEPVVLWQWINELLERVDIPPVRRSMPYAAGRCLASMLELMHHLLPCLGEPRLTRFVATQLAKSHYFSHARAQADFGYQTLVDNETGMTRLVEWLKNG